MATKNRRKVYTTPAVREAKLFAGALGQQPDNYLLCRDSGVRHAWDVIADFHVVPGQSEGRRKVTHVGRDLLCRRCECWKHEAYFVTRRNGVEVLERVGTPTYKYPDDYQIPGVPRGVKPQEIIHQEQYRRALDRALQELGT